MTVISASACSQVVTSANTVSNADGAVVGLRRCNLYGNTRHSVLSVTERAGGSPWARRSDGCGVGVGHSFTELGSVASEECPTGITELGVQLACCPLGTEKMW